MSRDRMDSGQIVSITAILLAVIVLTLAMVMNSVLYTKNLASEDSQVERNAQEVQELEERFVTFVNRTEPGLTVNDNTTKNVSHSVLHDRLRDRVRTFETVAQQYRSPGGKSVKMDVRVDGGTRILQTNPDRNYAAGGDVAGAASWKMLDNTTDLQRAQFNLSTDGFFSTLLGSTLSQLAGNAFHVAVRDERTGEMWKVYMFRGSLTDTVYVFTEEPGEDYLLSDFHGNWLLESCVARGDRVPVWLGEATVGEAHCPELSFFSNLQDEGAPLDVWFNRSWGSTLLFTGDRATGEYDWLVGDAESVNRNALYNASETTDGPRALTAVARTSVDVEYESDVLEYTSTHHFRPERFEPKDPGSPPSIDSFSVSDETTLLSGPEFDVSWTVSDPDDNLDSVVAVLVDSTGEPVDSTGSALSGGSDSGVTTVSDSILTSGDYTVEFVVRDTRGNAVNRTHAEAAG